MPADEDVCPIFIVLLNDLEKFIFANMSELVLSFVGWKRDLDGAINVSD